jgi:hypothetical protein
MDLSHPNLTAFIDRMIDDIDIDRKDVCRVIKELKFFQYLPIPLFFLRFFPDRVIKTGRKVLQKKDLFAKATKVRNLLSFMENSIEHDFLIMDHFLTKDRRPKDDRFTPPIVKNNVFTVGNNRFNKIVLCPLIIDFGYKNLKQDDIYYNFPPEKPVTRQITDLFTAIRTYYQKDIILNSSGYYELVDARIDPDSKLFEIFPFMGINTENYSYKEIEIMLRKYFSGFSSGESREERYRKLREKMGRFDGKLDDEEKCKNIFAGIKVYPALGFDPWPDDCPACLPNRQKNIHCNCKKAKVHLLYSFCTERNIPVITHCSKGGFKVVPNYYELGDPGGRWKEVLRNYPGLKIDFAHFGKSDPGWTSSITEMISDPGLDVYTDFSCNTEDNKFYKELDTSIASGKINKQAAGKILFGTDFMVNMLWTESYNYYLDCFARSDYLENYKTDFCQTNPEKFLFGK